MPGDARPEKKLALIVEYDGTAYKGFQYQTDAPTIQHELEKALKQLTGEGIRIRGASRTDSGVHAKGQAVDFLTHACFEERTWVKALNYHLPWDIKVKSAYPVPLDFHARRDATARTYRYTILNSKTPSPLMRRQSAWIEKTLDSKAMAKAAEYLIGLHDLSAFAGSMPPNKTSVRQVKRWDVWKENDLVLIEAEANGFLPHQILRTNGILVDIGKSKSPISTIRDMLKGSVIKTKGTSVLPSKGLCLVRIDYLSSSTEGCR